MSQLRATRTYYGNVICHPIFQHEDVLHSVLLWLSAPASSSHDEFNYKKKGRRYLFSAALVSRTFFNPAIALLWRELDSIMPVLRLIPSFVSVNDSYTINGMIKLESQNRVFHYSKHVRRLYLESPGAENITPQAVHHLLTLENILFPNLLSLGIFQSEDNPTADSAIFLTLSRSLTSFAIDTETGVTPSTENYVASYLAVLHQKGSQLSEIIVYGHLTDHSFSIIACFSKLKSLFLTLRITGILKSSTIVAWGGLPDLEEFTLVLPPGDWDFEPNSHHSECAGFPALHSLSLDSASPEVLNILQCFNNSKTLTSIKLMIPDTDPTKTYTQAISECIRISKSTLEEFSLTTNRFNTMYDASDGDVLPGRFIKLLSECEHLRALRCSPGVLADIDDKIIREVYKDGRWRNLRILQVPYCIQDRQQPSLASLKHISMNCPLLEELQICVDLRLLDDKSLKRKRRNAMERDNYLRTLSISASIIDASTRGESLAEDMRRAIEVSRFIDYCFPRVEDFKITTILPPAEPNRWWLETVQMLLFEYQDIREGEALVAV